MTDSRLDPLRVAIIGTGFGARVQLPGFMSLAETNVVALCGRSEKKTKDIAAQYGVRAVYTDYEQMLVDVQPDIVSITTPPHLHNPMTIAALQTGAHVLCEKPLAVTATEAREMLTLAEQYVSIHAVDFQHRYLPARYYQRVLVDQGYIGEPVLLEGTLYAPKRWDTKTPWSWWSDAKQGGGMLAAVGTHYIDAFRWLTGREVRAVNATLHTPPPYARLPVPGENTTREVTSDMNAILALEFDGGLQAAITLSAVAAGEVNRLAIHGTEGALVVNNHLELWGRRRDESLQPIIVPGEYEPPLWIPDENLHLGPFVKLAGLMVDRIRGRAVVTPPTFADGLAVQRVTDAAHQSTQTGARVAIHTA